MENIVVNHLLFVHDLCIFAPSLSGLQHLNIVDIVLQNIKLLPIHSLQFYKIHGNTHATVSCRKILVFVWQERLLITYISYIRVGNQFYYHGPHELRNIAGRPRNYFNSIRGPTALHFRGGGQFS